jgi:hypothetical protein
MTPERKKALLMIIGTLIIGILIGALGTGLIGREMKKRPGQKPRQNKEAFINKIQKVIDATPEQSEKIRPLIEETTNRIDSLEKASQQQVNSIIDSFEKKVEPILSEEQMKKLKDFHRKGRERRKD